MKHLIVSDSSLLIALININQLELLQYSFAKVIIPTMVNDEVERGLSFDSSWFSQKQQGFISVQMLKKDPRLPLLNMQLDPGESEAILLADQLKLPLLIDEKAGRKMALDLGLKIQGLVGLLYSLRQTNHISSEDMISIVENLGKVNFRMSNSLKALLLD